jgi:peptidyl-tRNA hydrolase, PTH1 family
MKYLIVGLGNIGEEYKNTRHNIGFKVLDKLTKDNSISFSPDRLADVSKFQYKSRQLILIKPSTYMNLSGKAVNYWMQKEKIALENVIIIVDDLALPFGITRLKGKGSDGGHNGLKHINQTLGHSNYNRLRCGIGNEFSKGKQIDYVLGEWGTDEQEKLPEFIEKAVQGILLFSTVGLDKTMTLINQK